MKKIIFLFFVLLGFTNLQAQETNDTSPKFSRTAEGVKVQKNAAKAATFASRKIKTNVLNRSSSSQLFNLAVGSGENIPQGSTRNTGITTAQVEQYINIHGTSTRVPLGTTVLHYIQDNFGGVNFEPMLTSIGCTVTSDTGGGNLDVLIPSQAWDLLLLQVNSNGLTAGEISAINNFIAGGGKVIMNYWDLDSTDPSLRASVGVANTIDFFAPLPVSVWDAGHPIFNTPNAVGGIAVLGDNAGNDNGDRLEPAGGASALAGFTGAPAANEAAIILANGDNTFYHGFAPGDMDLASVLGLYENEVEFLFGAPGCPPFSLDGPVCNGCSDPGSGSSLACSAGPNSIIQGIDVSGVPGNVNVLSFEYVQDTQGTAPGNVTVNVFCGAAGANPPPHSGTDTPLYSETFVVNGADDGSCVSLAFTTPPTIDGSCDTLWVEVLAATGRVVYTPPICNGNASTGTNTYIVAPGCGLTNASPLASIGFALDAGYSATFVCNLGEPPVISCPMDIIAPNDPGICGATVNFTDAIAIDPEDGIIGTTQTGGPASGSEFPLGDTIVTFSATDSDGNTSTCSFTVTVEDTEAPEVTCNDIIAELDASGNITILPEDVSVGTDNCPGVTYAFQATGGPSGSLTTLFAANNGGSNGGAVYFDVTVGAGNLLLDALELNTSEGGAFTVDVYTRSGSYVGTQNSSAGWTYQATGSGTSAGQDNPSLATLDVSVNLPATEVIGMALVFDASHGHSYTNGNGGNQNYANADIAMSLGTGSNTPFVGNGFTPRVWNGTLIYSTPAPPVPSLDFSCADIGDNPVTVIATDAAGNTSTCTAIVTVEDNIAPEIMCIGAPGNITVVEEFEGGTVPAGWSTQIVSGSWDWTFGSGDMPVGGDFPTNAAIFDDDAAGPSGDNNVASLLSPVWDLSAATSADVSFDYALQDFAGSGLLRAEAWDGAAWQEIFLADNADIDPTNTGSIDVTAYLNAAFQLKFTFDDEDSGWNWGAGVDNVTVNYNIPSIPLVVELDANGMASINAEDLAMNIDEACGYTVTTGGGAPVPGSLPTLFATNNQGNSGGAVYFDLTVGPESLSITDIDVNTNATGAFTMEVYSLEGTYVGNEGNPGAWTLNTSGNGSGAGIDNPSNVLLDVPVVLQAGTTYGMALVMDANADHRYTNGDGTNENYSNADLSLQAGAASNVPFDGSPFSPRVFNGSINYEIGDLPSATIDFDCGDLGLNQIEITVTDDSGNTASCTATVEVIDVTDPILVCMDATIELDENGMSEVDPEIFIDLDNSFDACGITITAVDVTDVTCDDIGSAITVTVFASDASGNLASCTATLTVVDAMGPTIENCPEDQTVDPGPNNLFYELPDYWTTGATATDNCTDPVTLLSQDPAAGTLLPDGTYTITLFAEDEYGNVSECTFELTIESVLGVDDNQLESGVVIYPNPAQGVMNISNSTNIELERAAIYDVNGRLVQNINLSNMATEKAVDVSNLASGVYMVQIQSNDGQTVKRLVKE